MEHLQHTSAACTKLGADLTQVGTDDDRDAPSLDQEN